MGVIIGMDPHKRSATIEVIDEAGRAVAVGRFGTDKTCLRKHLAGGDPGGVMRVMCRWRESDADPIAAARRVVVAVGA